MIFRPASSADAPKLSQILSALAAAGKRRKPCSPNFALQHYLEHPDQLACHLALDNKGVALGLQSLKLARPGNIYGDQTGCGIIGTHVDPKAARRGPGRLLFEITRIAARDAGVNTIDATIAIPNAAGLAFYDALGLTTYEKIDGAARKVFELR